MARNTVSVRELWEMAGMGESHFYKLVREGRGPRRIAEGSSHMATVEEARRWLGELERESGRRG
jgi:predicted DNA-binding transcriptional regulator AlpA